MEEGDYPTKDFSVGPQGVGRYRWEILEVLRGRGHALIFFLNLAPE